MNTLLHVLMTQDLKKGLQRLADLPQALEIM